MKERSTVYPIAEGSNLTMGTAYADFDVTCKLGDREVVISKDSNVDVEYKGTEDKNIVIIDGKKYKIGGGFKYPKDADKHLLKPDDIIMTNKAGEPSILSNKVTIEGDIGGKGDILANTSLGEVKIIADIYRESLSFRSGAHVTLDRCVQGLKRIKFEGSKNIIKVSKPTFISELSFEGTKVTMKLSSVKHEIDISKGNYNLSTSEDGEVHLDLIGSEEFTIIDPM